MSDDRFAAPYDDLQRATDAMRHVEIPEQPSRQDMAKLLERLPCATRGTALPEPPARRKIAAYRNSGLLAASVAVIGCAIGWLVLADSKVTWADTLLRMRASQTISFRSTVTSKGFPTFEMRQTMAAPGYLRICMRRDEKDAGIAIFDQQKSAGLMLLPARKEAVKMQSSDDLPKQAVSIVEFIEWLKTTSDHADEDLGPRTIGGKATFGFRVSKDAQKWDVWVDQDSRLPVRMESQFSVLDRSAAVVMDEFAFDHALDMRLFSLTPPPGYIVIDEVEIRDPSEHDLVALVRDLADRNNGEFPADLDMATLVKLGKRRPKEPAETGLKETLMLTRGLMFFQTHRAKYTGRGVKLGDAEGIVVWWNPKGQSTFRAVHGDLSVRDGDTNQPPGSE